MLFGLNLLLLKTNLSLYILMKIATMQLVKTLLADYHSIFLEGLKTVLKKDPEFQHRIIGCTSNGKILLELWEEHKPDLLIMDLNLMEKHGLEVIERIRRKKNDHTSILVITGFQDDKILHAILDQGANGYLPKHKGEAELYDAIGTVLAGKIFRSEPGRNNVKKSLAESFDRSELITEVFVKQHRLTKRETQILSLISQAMSNKEIGKKLFISDQTVSVHRKNIMRKLGVRSTAGLIKMTYDHCLQ